MVNKLVGIAVIFLLGGCTAFPEQIKVSQQHKLIYFNDVSEKSVGETVRWGGVITELSNQNGVVNVTVNQFPLLDSGQPTYASGSGGRFAAKFNNPLDLASLEQGTVLTLVGKVEEVQNPYPELRTTQLAIVRADDFYVWNGFSRADHPTVVDKDNDPAFIQRGKWGWQVKSEKEMQRERRERKNQQNSRY